jgi:hypothetical protein
MKQHRNFDFSHLPMRDADVWKLWHLPHACVAARGRAPAVQRVRVRRRWGTEGRAEDGEQLEVLPCLNNPQTLLIVAAA